MGGRQRVTLMPPAHATPSSSLSGYVGHLDPVPVAASQPPQPLPVGAYRLQTSPLRGYIHHGDLAHLLSLKIGDALALVAEPANPHDRHAVRVHHGERHVGYLPRESNHVVSRLLRQGAPLRAAVAWIDPTSDFATPLTLHVLWDAPLTASSNAAACQHS